MELLPTWMELAGPGAVYPGESIRKEIPPLDGVSFAASFRGKPFSRSRPMYFQYGNGRAIRDVDWKLIKYKNEDWELYHLLDDRTEI